MKEKSHRTTRRCYRSVVEVLQDTDARRLDGYLLGQAGSSEATIMLRKHVGSTPPQVTTAVGPEPDGSLIPVRATMFVTSESGYHPVDHLFDGRNGPGGTRWIASADGDQTLTLAFDAPQTIREVALETEEQSACRTQVLTLSLSQDDGRTYREIVRQEFNFSPPDTTFEREVWSVPASHATRLRIVIQPDKGGAPGRATLTSLSIR